MKRLLIILFTFTLLFFTEKVLPAFANLQAIPNADLPSGQRDLFNTDLFTGSSSYSYPIRVPKGTNDLTPSVSLSYNNLGTFDTAQYAGNGWEVNTNYIQRDVRNTPGDTSDDRYILHFQGTTYNLIYNPTDSLFHTKIESHLKIQQFLSGGLGTTGMYWQVTTPDGTLYRFGYQSNSELICSGQSYDGYWYLDQVQDTHNNHIYYSYLQNTGIAYLGSITYNNDQQREVDFNYTTNPYQRQLYVQGCSISEVNRLSNIYVKARASLVHQYDISYSQALNGQNLLGTITEKGSDGTALPPTTFTYNPEIQSWSTSPQTWLNSPAELPLNTSYLRVIDVNGDGLPDIVKTDGTLWAVMINTGSSWNPNWAIWSNNGNVSLSSTNVQLIDVTGDGLPDIVQSVNNGGTSDTWYVYRNTGSSWSTTPETWLNINGGNVGNATVDLNISNSHVKLMDVNGDGLADIVWSGSTNTVGNREWLVYLNTGNNTWSTTPQYWINDTPFNYSLEMTNVQLMDVNGDGLPDIVESTRPSVDVWDVFFNTGSGWTTTPAQWFYGDNNIQLNYNDVALVDVNGDGLPDIVHATRPSVDEWDVFLNTGNGWTTNWVKWINADLGIQLDYSNVKIADVNGDGLPDIMISPTGQSIYSVYLNNGYSPDMLSTVTTQQGGTIHYDYKQSTQYINTLLPFNTWVVQKMTLYNGLSNSQGTNSITSYSYKNGLYSWQNREFRGFGEVDVTNPNNSITQNTFAQDDALKGNLTKAYTFDSQNNPYAETDNTWSSSLANNIYTVTLGKTLNYTYDGVASNPKITETDYQYDAYGNQTKISELGDTSITGDERYTYNEYATNPSNWIINKLSHSYLNKADDITKISETWNYYDNATPSASPTPSPTPPVSVFGDGHDGNLTITTNTTETPIDSSVTATAGGTTATVGSGLGFISGQLVLLIQMQQGSTGAWELAHVQSYSGTTLTLTAPLVNSYSSVNNPIAQIRVVPQYHNVTVNAGVTWSAKPWNGTTGGILAFLANGTVSINGTILGDGLGFRGGGAATGNTLAYSGEGTAGGSVQNPSANGNGGGGGAGLNFNGAGGGGGNGAPGITGTDNGDGTGGNVSSSSDLTTMTLGGAGGGGAGNGPAIGGVGGNGGAIIFFTASTFTNSGTGVISSNGTNGGNASNTAGHTSGGGSGGAGGSILIKAQTANIGTNLITATSGSGGVGGQGGPSGVSGGVGAIRIEYGTLTGTTNPAASLYQNPALIPPPPPQSNLTKGDLTAEVKWRNTGGTNPMTTYTYDSYGNQTSITDDNNHTTQFVYGITDTTNTYPEKVINAKTQSTLYSYDLGTGNMLSKADPNGYATSYTYDVFGRQTGEVDPYDSTLYPTVLYQYFDTTSPQGKLVARRTTAGLTNVMNTYTFTDGFGRTIQTRSDAEDPTKQVVTDVFYDPTGLVSSQTVPHLDTLSTAYATSSSGLKTVASTYDILGRITTITNPDLTTRKTTYDHFTKTLTDENNHTQNQVLNAFNKIIEVDENNGGSLPFTTLYTYDSKDQLTKITDNASNNTTFTYDTLGNKISQVDPDMGTWNYTYDGVGNLLTQTDNRSVTITKSYDPLDRILTIHSPTNGDITYTYDTNTIGTLASKSDFAGTVNYTYDQRLRKSQETRIADGQTWITGYGYDSADRLSSQTNPDGATVTYSYNPQGKISAVSGVISNIDYNAQGNPTGKTFANSLTTNYTYDPNSFRLTRIKTSPFQDLIYTYDGVGNVTSIKDNTTNVIQNFGYDFENRLTNASASDGSYNYTYAYDPIGNLIQFANSLNSTTYTYGQQAGPHAITAASDPVAVSPTPSPTPTPTPPPFFGNGSDGSLTVSSNTTDSPIDSAASGTVGTTTLSATNASFAAGQAILVIQMQGANTGVWERNAIQSYTAGTITTVTPLTNTYSNTGTNKAQVLVLKQYTNVTENSGITWSAKPWNGTTGGILAFLANGTVSINGTILGNGLGFRGGAAATGNTIAYSGEGTGGSTSQTTSANGNGGGGGGGLNFNAAGGGGGNGGPGITGTDNGDGIGGSTSSSSDLTTMTLGGAGGGGAGNGPAIGGVGGNGGAIIFLTVKNFTNAGIITSNGINGGDASNTAGHTSGGGSGGAGGSILIKTQTSAIGPNAISAPGGTGGIGGQGGPSGFSGGAGVIRIEYVTLSGTTTNPPASLYQYASPSAALNINPTSGTAPVNVTADASGSVPGSNPLTSYTFNFGDGTILGPQSIAYASHSYTVPGTYTVTVTVTDTLGLSATASQTAVVVNPPVARLNVTPSTGVVPLAISADASSSTQGTNPISTYTFAFGDGAVIGPQASSSATHTYTNTGTFTVTVTITDTTGISSTASQTVTVNGPTGPTASLNLSSSTATAPASITLNASGSTAGTYPISTYTFNFGDGSALATQSGATINHTFSTSGTYTETVLVTDTFGLQSSASKTLTITNPVGPTANLSVSPSTGIVPIAVTASASGSVPGSNPISTYTFNFGDGTIIGPQSTSSATHTYTTVGTYSVVVTVTDSINLTATASKTVTTNPAPPTAALSVSPTIGTVPIIATASATGSTQGTNPISSYTFNFGDGSPLATQSGATLAHTYNTAGTYTVTVTVKDTANLASSASQSVTFSPILNITNVSSGIPGQTTATITWTTNAGGTSQVIYGTTSGNLTSSTTLDSNLVTSHSVSITGLTKNKTYYYKVLSKNAASTQYSSAQFSFTTSH